MKSTKGVLGILTIIIGMAVFISFSSLAQAGTLGEYRISNSLEINRSTSLKTIDRVNRTSGTVKEVPKSVQSIQRQQTTILRPGLEATIRQQPANAGRLTRPEITPGFDPLRGNSVRDVRTPQSINRIPLIQRLPSAPSRFEMRYGR